VAEELRASGWTAALPDITGWSASAAATWQAWVTEACREILRLGGAPAVLVGHSGAGPLLPALAAKLTGRVAGLIFVDADLPPPAGPMALAPPELLAKLRGLAKGGRLPPWSEWWGTRAMEKLVPDRLRRQVIESELPRLPSAYFEAEVVVPAGWTSIPTGYMLLSPAYAEMERLARRRGLPTTEVRAGHLGIAAEPAAVAEGLRRLAEALPPSAPR
jgi:pimeloyl-ACP methyl ester carboxylesterase